MLFQTHHYTKLRANVQRGCTKQTPPTGDHSLGFDQSVTAIDASDTLPPIPTEEREAGSGANLGSMWEMRKENALCFM